MWVLVVVLVALLFGALFGGEEDDPADYPQCFDIVRQPGTDPDAKCVSVGEVIKAREHSMWKRYHPYD